MLDWTDAEWDQWQAGLIHRLKSQPPRCLKDVQAAPNHAEEWNGLARWEIDCPCGNRTGRVYGHPLSQLNPDYAGAELHMSPLTFECVACGRRACFFDSGEHGYDAECARKYGGSYRGASYRGEGLGQAASCPGCGGQEQRITAEFSHPDFDIIEDDAELEPVVQDFFGGFRCHAACVACGHQWTLGSFELA